MKIFVAFAINEEEQLGFSPCMRPILHRNKVVMEIKLGQEYFVTTGETISDFCARRCIGRGTRVLVVQRKKETKPTRLALKIY